MITPTFTTDILKIIMNYLDTFRDIVKFMQISPLARMVARKFHRDVRYEQTIPFFILRRFVGVKSITARGIFVEDEQNVPDAVMFIIRNELPRTPIYTGGDVFPYFDKNWGDEVAYAAGRLRRCDVISEMANKGFTISPVVLAGVVRCGCSPMVTLCLKTKPALGFRAAALRADPVQRLASKACAATDFFQRRADPNYKTLTMINAARCGRVHIVNDFIKELAASSKDGGCWEEGMAGAARGYNFAKYRCGDESLSTSSSARMEIIQRFIELGAHDWDKALTAAARGGSQDFFDYFAWKGASKWGIAMAAAARGGHLKLVQMCIARSVEKRDCEEALKGASRGGHEHIIDFLVPLWHSSGVDEIVKRCIFNECLELAGAGGHVPVIEYWLRRGATEEGRAMLRAAQKGRKAALIFLFDNSDGDMGASYSRPMDILMVAAARNGQYEIVRFLLAEGAWNLSQAYEAAIRAGHNDIIQMFATMGTTRARSSPYN